MQAPERDDSAWLVGGLCADRLIEQNQTCTWRRLSQVPSSVNSNSVKTDYCSIRVRSTVYITNTAVSTSLCQHFVDFRSRSLHISHHTLSTHNTVHTLCQVTYGRLNLKSRAIHKIKLHSRASKAKGYSCIPNSNTHLCTSLISTAVASQQ